MLVSLPPYTDIEIIDNLQIHILYQNKIMKQLKQDIIEQKAINKAILQELVIQRDIIEK